MSNNLRNRVYGNYRLRPESMTNFEYVCLAASLINVLILVKFYIGFFGRVMAYVYVHNPAAASQHFERFLVIDILSTLIAILFFIPLLSMPYWLALLISRLKLKVAKFFFYTTTILFWLSTLGDAAMAGLHDLTVALSLAESALLIFAMFLLNASASREWLRSY